MSKLLVEKLDGVLEDFDSSKLKKSLTNSDCSILLANEISAEIEKEIAGKTTTEEIYRIAFEKLKNTEKKTASRYSLRRSLLGLGPTGFPFERFIAKIFDKKGYKTKTGITLNGSCVTHEVDVVAVDDDDLILCEVKFHNNIKTKTDTKVALYIKARYDDLKEKEYTFFGNTMKPTKGLIITNTKFTNNAKKYAKCVDLGIISWDYPKRGNLYDLIEETEIQPITSLVSATKSEKENMIRHDIIDCKDLINNPKLLSKIGFPKNKILKITKEAKNICSK